MSYPGEKELLEQHFLELKTYKPKLVEDDLLFVEEAIETDTHYEPFGDVGDVMRLLQAAANLAMFTEEYRKRTGSLELPEQS